MKALRPLIVSLVLMIAAVPAMADDANRQIGIIGGFNIANLKMDTVAGLQSRSTFAIGGIFERDLNERWGLRIEPVFITKGAKVTQRDAYLGSVDKIEVKLAYFEIPLLLRLDLGEDRARGYLLGGAGIAFRTQSEAELVKSGTAETVDFTDIFRGIDANLQFGMGGSVPAGPNRVFIDGRASFGLVDISKGGTVEFQGQTIIVDPIPVSNYGFRIMGGILFPWPGT